MKTTGWPAKYVTPSTRPTTVNRDELSSTLWPTLSPRLTSATIPPLPVSAAPRTTAGEPRPPGTTPSTFTFVSPAGPELTARPTNNVASATTPGTPATTDASLSGKGAGAEKGPELPVRTSQVSAPTAATVLRTSTVKLFATPLIIRASPNTSPVATAASRKRRNLHCRSLKLARTMDVMTLVLAGKTFPPSSSSRSLTVAATVTQTVGAGGPPRQRDRRPGRDGPYLLVVRWPPRESETAGRPGSLLGNEAAAAAFLRHLPKFTANPEDLAGLGELDVVPIRADRHLANRCRRGRQWRS